MIRTRFYCPTCHTAMIAAVTLPAARRPCGTWRSSGWTASGSRANAAPAADGTFPATTPEQFEEQLAKNW